MSKNATTLKTIEMKHFEELYEKNRELSERYPDAIILFQSHRGLTAVDVNAGYLIKTFGMPALTTFVSNHALVYTGFGNTEVDEVMGAIVRSGKRVAMVTSAHGSDKILRSVRVTYTDGSTITTAMAAHLTDEEIYAYFCEGKPFNIGMGVADDWQAVSSVEILF